MVALLSGVLLRARLLLEGRPLWLDEAMVALNLLDRGYLELLQPLDYDQAAPPLFLWIAKLAGSLGAGGEIYLRVPAFVAGVVALIMVWRAARALFSPEVGGAVTLLVALSPPLIYYSAELKPYMTDAVATLSLVWAASVVRVTPTRGAGWWALLLGGMVAPWLSYTAPFGMAAAGAILLGRAWSLPHRWPVLRAVLLMGGVWLLHFAALYLLVTRPAAVNPYLQEFWLEEQLGNFPSPYFATWYVTSVLAAPLPLPENGIRVAVLLPVAMLLVLGTARRFGVATVVPLGVAVGSVLLASWARLYPVETRLFLFLAPLTLGCVAAGIIAGLQGARVPPPARGVVVVAGILMLASWGGEWRGRGPGLAAGRERPLELIAGRPPGSPVYILPGGGPQYVYHTSSWGRPDHHRLRWFADALSWGGPAFRGAHLAGGLPPGPTAPLQAPGGAGEFVAYASGSGQGVAGERVEEWAAAEAERLVALQVPEVWLYAGAYHQRELPLLSRAIQQRGGAVDIRYESELEVVLRIQLDHSR